TRPTRRPARDRRVVPDEVLSAECRRRGARVRGALWGLRTQCARDRHHRRGHAETPLLREIYPREPTLRARTWAARIGDPHTTRRAHGRRRQTADRITHARVRQ